MLCNFSGKSLVGVLPLLLLLGGCREVVPEPGDDTAAPLLLSTNPFDTEVGISTNRSVTATFNEAMDPSTIDVDTFILTQGGVEIAGIVTSSGAVATFNPTGNLAPNTVTTALISTRAADLAGNTLASNESWTFTTSAGAGPSAVDLGDAGGFVILAKSGIDTASTSAILGDIGVSPIDSTAITGFSLILDATGTFATSNQVTGQVFAADFADPTPANLTAAILDMEAATTDAAGRSDPDFTELGAGDISGLTLTPGLYKWGTGVLISTEVTLQGDPNDTWIFQIAGDLTMAPGAAVLLAGGAQPENIFWQSSGTVALDTTAHLEGIILGQTEITLATGASVDGRLFSQTAVTLDSSVVDQP